jgi:small nuclear ribonucleoprotein (snRNP)-like protein
MRSARTFRGSVTGMVLAALVAASAAYAAGPAVVELEGVGYNVQSTIADNLRALTGKSVTITLTSGKQFSGKVKAVGPHMLHVEKLDGREYFDALIRLEQVEAIDTRFREVQR